MKRREDVRAEAECQKAKRDVRLSPTSSATRSEEEPRRRRTMTPHLWQLSACELADGKRRASFSCVDAMESVAGRIHAINTGLNASEYDDTAAALAEARRA